MKTHHKIKKVRGSFGFSNIDTFPVILEFTEMLFPEYMLMYSIYIICWLHESID